MLSYPETDSYSNTRSVGILDLSNVGCTVSNLQIHGFKGTGKTKVGTGGNNKND